MQYLQYAPVAYDVLNTGYKLYHHPMFRTPKSTRARSRTPSLRGSRKRLRTAKPSVFTARGPVGGDRLPTRVLSRGRRRKKSLRQKVSEMQYPPFTIQQSLSGVTTSTSPNQGVVDTSLVTNSILRQGYDKVREIYAGSTAVMEGNMPAAGDSTTPWKSNFKLIVQSMSFVTSFYNAASMTCDLEVMILTPRRLIDDTDNGTYIAPGAWWTKCNQDARPATNAVAPLDTDALAGLPISVKGDRPYKRSTRALFNRWWKIVASDKRVLQPGQQWKHSFKVNSKRTLNFEDIHQFAQQPGLSYWMIIIQNGQLVGSAEVGNQISYSDSKIGYVQERRITYSYMSATRPVYFRSNALTAITSANQRAIDPEDRQEEVWNDEF